MFSILVFTYLLEFRPFVDPAETKIDVYNELWVMISTNLLFLFTEYTPVEARFKYGYVYIALFGFAWISNIAYQIITRIKEHYRNKAIQKTK